MKLPIPTPRAAESRTLRDADVLHPIRRKISLLTLLLPLALLALTLPALAADPVPAAHSKQMARSLALFNSEVRPLLKRNCINCHGGEKIRAGLNLNTREGLLEGGDNGPAARIGNSRESLLIALIEHREEPFMPKSDEKVLDSEQISSFARWIDTGAAYSKPILNPEEAAASDGPMTVTEEDRDFWSFRPLSKPAPPQKYNADWSRGPIDDFVAAKHETEGLRPNPEADPAKLIRRLHFDLTGLPPTPDEVDAFVQACKTGNRESQVSTLINNLLASPRYGEKWARHWLDVARFAESHGFEQDYDRPYAYHYRDFVIRAFNEDMPYDQFVKWQLAGDEIAPDRPLAMMATGFLGAGVFPTQLTEKEFESARYDELDDMAATTGTAFLGLTIGCARCHDHKYDPIPVKDYYRLVSTFTTTIRSEIDIDLDPIAYRTKKAAWEKDHAPLAAALKKYENGPLKKNFESLLAKGTLSTSPPVAWHPLDPIAFKSREGAKLTKLEDGSYLASGENPKTDDYTITVRTQAKAVTAIRIEALTHRSLPRNGPGRARNGNFALSNLTIRARPLSDKKAKLADVTIASAVATHEQNDGRLSAKSIFDDSVTASAWAVDKGGIGSDQAIVVTLEKPVSYPGGAEISLMLKFANNTQHSMGRTRISFTTKPGAPVVVGNDLALPVGEALALLESDGPAALNPSQRETLFKWYAPQDNDWKKRHAAVEKSLDAEPDPTVVKVQITGEGYPKTKHHADGRGFPHFYPDTYHLARGDVHQKGNVAEPGFLQVLLRSDKTETHWQEPPPADARYSGRRSALAHWITDTEHGAGHLLARVIVNRLWHYHFGRGIVATPSDFGLQGTRPSHPELLDYLAGELVRNGWKLKPIHRQILLSATWRQSGAPDPAMARLDPDNRHLWRFTPRRLEAENLRDSLLALSGSLDETMYGPGSLDPGNPRRSIYLFIKRSNLIPMMQVFDTPEPLVGQGSRPSTTIAPQALILMNNVNVRNWIDGFAARLDKAAPHSLEQAITEGYRIALGRSPTPSEHRSAVAFLEDQLVDYKHAARTDARVLALGDLCQILVSLNEFAYIE